MSSASKTITAAPSAAEEQKPAVLPIKDESNARFLSGPITPALLRLALPVLIVLAIQTSVSVTETWFISRLGTDALAGASLVFPLFMLMTMVSSGGIGGGVSSAVARALGGKRIDDANALLLHTLLVASGFGLLFTGLMAWFGPALFGLMGGKGAALENALRYSQWIFGTAVLIWIVNLIGAALRGAGEVKLPAMVMVRSSFITILLSPALIFGVGPLPGFGIAGAGMAMLFCYSISTFSLLRYLRSTRSPLRLSMVTIEWRLLKEILGVGLLASLGALQSNLVAVFITGLVGVYGVDAIAGYGIASRLDYVLSPLMFAIGTACVTMVGTNVGAGNVQRAKQIALHAVMLSGGLVALVGVFAALLPQVWVHLFSLKPEVVQIAVQYLRSLGPVYVFSGIGMALIFASQGAQRIGAPVLTGTVVLLFTLGAGWYCVQIAHASYASFFLVVAASRVLFGLVIGLTFVLDKGWGGGRH